MLLSASSSVAFWGGWGVTWLKRVMWVMWQERQVSCGEFLSPSQRRRWEERRNYGHWFQVDLLKVNSTIIWILRSRIYTLDCVCCTVLEEVSLVMLLHKFAGLFASFSDRAQPAKFNVIRKLGTIAQPSTGYGQVCFFGSLLVTYGNQFYKSEHE